MNFDSSRPPLIFHLKNRTNQSWAFFILKIFLGGFQFCRILAVAAGQVCSGPVKPAGAGLRPSLTIVGTHSFEQCVSFCVSFCFVFLRFFFLLYLQNQWCDHFAWSIFAFCCMFSCVSCRINCSLICLLVYFLCFCVHSPACLIFCSVFLRYFIVFFLAN